MVADVRVDEMLASPLGRELLLALIDPMAEDNLDWSSEGAAQSTIRAAVALRKALPDDPVALLVTLARTAFSFGFDGADDWLWPLTQEAKEELRPVADALVARAVPLGWWEPLHRPDQRILVWEDLPEIGEGGIEGLVRESSARQRARNEEGLARGRPRPRQGARVGATWWSAPDFAPLTWTTGAVPPLPTIALLSFVDTHQPFKPTGARIFSLEIDPGARVYEVASPEDWRRLVERFPEDATGTHDGEWRDWGGVAGPWLLPDWEEVMAHYDGVHVSAGAFVASCGLALPVGDAYTMLAGWVPDATLWLRDVAVARRLLGRWHGWPTASVEEVMATWTPA